MKISFKYIILLVILALSCIFSYQAHWLLGVYRTQKEEMELHVTDAMISADIAEMMLRVKRMEADSAQAGAIEVGSGLLGDHRSYTKVNTFYQHRDSVLYNSRKTIYSSKQTVIVDNKKRKNKDTMVINEADTTPFATDERKMQLELSRESFGDMATRIQQALHSGLDHISKVNIAVYDSILDRQLYLYRMYRPHRVELVHYTDSSLKHYTVIARTQTNGYRPSLKAKTFEYFTDIDAMRQYRVTMEPLTTVVLKQMGGVLFAAFVTFSILLLTYWYLVRTLWKQKTLDEMKSDFTNNITHELKTPIAIAYAANDALLNFRAAENPEKAKEYLRIGQEQLQRLGGMVEQILAMSMERRRTLELKKEPILVKSVLEPLVAQYKLKTDKQVTILLTVHPEALTLLADRLHFYNMIGNLIDNAVKYSKEYVDIRIDCRKRPEGEGVEISVADNGIGITQEKQRYIFDKFYRIPNGNRHEVQGYGLGLFYVKQMVERHGGTIAVKSVPNKGTTFHLQFR
ncbi:sensor histidine kinase [Phocaeicola abscessus]|uniref:sensor histidine kinase n=1 Tax=Phocaeicola abscessus TaxID=555313 RepID=UPI0004235BBD|nr:HAMP domain-containing sensor histidine kinase [Phocaeicola abscessus]